MAEKTIEQMSGTELRSHVSKLELRARAAVLERVIQTAQGRDRVDGGDLLSLAKSCGLATPTS